MNLLQTALASLLGLTWLAFTGCGGTEASTDVIRVSAIPDELKTEVSAMQDKLCSYLKAQTGMDVRFEPSNNYPAAVNGLLTGALDLVWLGGVTSVEADQGAAGKAVFLATRDIDLKFKSYFIANSAAIEAGKVSAVDKLEDLQGQLSELTFTFGSPKSTSGHVMPRHFMLEAGIDPEKDFRSGAAYSGSHSKTLTDVAGGAVDLGALNYSTYDKASAEQQAKAKIIYTTPEYVDYCWIGHKRLGDETLDKIRAALIALEPSNPDHKVILDAWGAGKFVEAQPAQWDGIRSVLKSLPKDFMK